MSILFADITEDYLAISVERLMGMVYTASSDSKPNVVSYIDPQMNPPFWWLYPGQIAPEQLAQDIERQPFEIIARYAMGYVTQGYDGNIGKSLWVNMPKIINFINSHRSLVYLDGQAPVPFLDMSKVRARQLSGFGALQGYNHLGIEIAISLSFTVQIEQEW